MNLPAPFRHEGEHLAIEFRGGAALFTTRRGGVSRGPYTSLNLGTATGDDAAVVEANRELLAKVVDVPRERFVQGRQVHEATVIRHRAPPQAGERRRATADGQATDQTRVAPVVLTADCLPVALVAPEAVAMLHCGWRGLAAGIVAEGVAALRELGAGGSVAAAIGPGAGRCCYEVGDEVRAAFGDLGPEVREGRNLDLTLVARRRLESAGVAEVHDAELCTMCSDPTLFFSHRRDGALTGRQAGVAWRS
ncbi:MAG TPA: polyphenol oxidase family protein [Solirubrobacteraceae bacterium]|nr:polyphenol oxidase family protein [Solirubrobacteraceae bacterium]